MNLALMETVAFLTQLLKIFFLLGAIILAVIAILMLLVITCSIAKTLRGIRERKEKK